MKGSRESGKNDTLPSNGAHPANGASKNGAITGNGATGLDAAIVGLARLASLGDGGEPAFSICSTCGRRVEGTDKRKYCGRQCANKALLVRRRLARARMIDRLTR
jgi:hypothetical protein